MRIRGVLVLLVTLLVVVGAMAFVSLSLTGRVVDAGAEKADTSIVRASGATLNSGEKKTDGATAKADECDATFKRIYGPTANCVPLRPGENKENLDILIAIQKEHDAAFAAGAYANATEEAIKRVEKLLQSDLSERERGEAEAYLAQLHREKAAQLVEESETLGAAMSELEKAGELYEQAAESFTSAGFSDIGESAEIFAGNTFLALVELVPTQTAENLAKAEAAYQKVLVDTAEKRDPRAAAAAIGLAQTAIANGDLDAAMAFLDRAEQYDVYNPNTLRLRKAIVQGSTLSVLEAIKEGYERSTQKNLKAFEDYWSLNSPVMGVLQQTLETGSVVHAKLRNDASKALDQLIQAKNDENANMMVALTFMEGLVRRGYTMQDIHAMSYEQRKEALQSLYGTLKDKRAGEISFAIGKSFENGDVAKLTRLGNQAHRFFKNAPTLDYTDNSVQSVVDEIAAGKAVYNVPNVIAASFVGVGAGQILSYSYARAGFTFVTRASTDKALVYGFGVGVLEGQFYSQGVVLGSAYIGKKAIAAGAPEWVANDLNGAGEILSNLITFSPISARVTKWAGGKAVDLKLEEKSQYLLGEKTLYQGVKAKTLREKTKIERELLNQGWERVKDPDNPGVVLLLPRAEPAIGGGIPARRSPLVVYHDKPPSRIRGEVIFEEMAPRQLHEYVLQKGQATLRETLATRPMTVKGDVDAVAAAKTRDSVEASPVTGCATGGCDVKKIVDETQKLTEQQTATRQTLDSLPNNPRAFIEILEGSKFNVRKDAGTLIVSKKPDGSDAVGYGTRGESSLSLISKSREELFPIRRIDPDTPRETVGSVRIDEKTIDTIFQHQYDPSKPEIRGAKGLVYIDSFGAIHVRFWKTGEGTKGIEVHHRDTLSDLVAQESRGLESLSYSTNDQNLINKAALYEILSIELSQNRKQDTVPEELLIRSEGFQFTRDKNGKIAFFDVDSSITATQVSRKIPLNAKTLSEMITAVHNSISPEYRAYRNIRIKDLGKLRLDGPLNLPMRAVELE